MSQGLLASPRIPKKWIGIAAFIFSRKRTAQAGFWGAFNPAMGWNQLPFCLSQKRGEFEPFSPRAKCSATFSRTFHPVQNALQRFQELFTACKMLCNVSEDFSPRVKHSATFSRTFHRMQNTLQRFRALFTACKMLCNVSENFSPRAKRFATLLRPLQRVKKARKGPRLRGIRAFYRF